MKNLRRYGDRGWLIDIDSDGEDSRAWLDRLSTPSLAHHVQDVVVSDVSVLVIATSANAMDELAQKLSAPVTPASGPILPNLHTPRTIVVPIRYDGCDLAEVARRTHTTEAEVARRHSQSTYSVAFFGFAPGFAYLRGLAEDLNLPRRDTPRERITAGTVAIAGEFTVIYPGRTPGGWHLIGTTDLLLWDLREDPPNRLDIGDRVVFEQISSSS